MEAGWLLNTIKIVSFFIGANPLPYAGMLIWFAFSVFYVRRAFANYTSVNVVVLQFIPFIFTILGLLGTVSGALTVAWNFDAASLTDAATNLFKGILGAGSCTMIGLILAMVFSKLVHMTQLKEEQQKALQNRELFVLKKILKLMKADYDRDAVHNAQYKDGFKSLQDILELMKQDNNIQSELFLDALQRPGEQISNEMAVLRSELSVHFKTLIDAQQLQNRLLDQVRESLSSEEENAIPGRLLVMQQQSQLASQYMEQRISGMQTALQQQVKSSAAVLNQTMENTGKELVETIRTNGSEVSKQNEALLQHVRSLDATSAETRKELGNGLKALRKAADDLPHTLERNNRTLLKKVSDKSDAVLARIQETEENTSADLGAIVFAAEEHTRTLQGLIEAASAGITESRGLLMDKLQAVLLRQQNHAKDSTDLITGLAKNLTEQFRSTFSAAEQQQLHKIIDFFQTRLEAYDAVAENLGAELKSVLERNSGHVGQLHLNAQEQRDQLSALAQQIETVGNTTQETKGTLQELTRNTHLWVENNQTLQTLVQQVKSTESAVSSLDQAMDKIEQFSRKRDADNSQALGSVLAQANRYAAIKDELSHSMSALLHRLREIEDIKKTDARFWNQVQRQIQDGIPIIMGGNKLDLQHADLDAGFRDRLNQSFVNLDRMLETIVQGYKKRSNGNGNGAHARSQSLLGQEGIPLRIS